MTDKGSAKERPLPKFSNVDRNSYWRHLAQQEREKQAPLYSPKGNAPVANALKQPAETGGNPERVPNKLVEQHKSVRYQGPVNPPVERQVEPEKPVADPAPAAEAQAARSQAAIPDGHAAPQARSQVQRASAFLAKSTKAGIHAIGRSVQRMRLLEWRRRYLALLALIHRHVFDRRVEQLLFRKTPRLQVYDVRQTESGPKISFLYQGPIPRKCLGWALSALPADLKRYAFVDFHAGNGRTLLLAARRDFEHATGYAFDAEGAEVLEMNLAQYSRSYMSCRDVRTLRGDREGVEIPAQPAVLFIPHSMPASYLEIILSNVTASHKLNPRSIYLIFENAGCEGTLDQMKFFERVPLPILNRIKTFLFSPAKIAVYRSIASGSTD
ncbi:MAG: hypothetical protein HY765_08930 [Rhodomicrobium sp.]|nr:hypothetical protein [Rhodomicrobium sp.]